MSSAIEIVGYGAIVPGVISIALHFVLRRWLPPDLSRRYALAAALAAAFIAAHVLLLPSWAELVPTRHWHWLPYLAAAALVLGPSTYARGVWPVERWLIHGMLSVASACLLVPVWSSIEPTRHWYIGFLSVYLFGLATFLPPLASRVSQRMYLGMLSIAAVVLALTILVVFSIQYGTLAGITAAALSGCCLAGWQQDEPLARRGVAPVYAILVGGAAFVGYIGPQSPLTGLLVLPAAPLALWLSASPWIPQGDRKLLIVQLVSVAATLSAGVGWVLWRS